MKKKRGLSAHTVRLIALECFFIILVISVLGIGIINHNENKSKGSNEYSSNSSQNSSENNTAYDTTIEA